MTTPVTPTSKFVEVNGLRLHYLDWGNPGAPVIVCVHGLTSHAHALDGFARRCAGRSTLLLWGSISDVLSEAQALKIVATLPHGTLATVAGSAHAPTLDEPDAAAALESFLSTPIAPPASARA